MVDNRNYETEFYHLDRIEKLLADDAELREFMNARGLHQVETCDEARTFMALKLEFESHAGPVDDSHLPPAPIEEDGQSGDDDAVDKIIDGQSWSNGTTVYLRWFSGGNLLSVCSGTLIGAREVLTAAHCSTFDGLQAITVQYQNGTCISHANCQAQPATLLDFERTDNYPGTGSVSDDVGILIGAANWTSPANVNSAWTRVAESGVGLNQQYWLLGYGGNAQNGSGGGVQRMSTSDVTVAFSDVLYFYSNRGSTGGWCTGDSGGGGIATNLAGSNINIGPNSHTEKQSGGSCTKAGGEMYTADWAALELHRGCDRSLLQSISGHRLVLLQALLVVTLRCESPYPPS